MEFLPILHQNGFFIGKPLLQRVFLPQVLILLLSPFERRPFTLCHQRRLCAFLFVTVRVPLLVLVNYHNGSNDGG